MVKKKLEPIINSILLKDPLEEVEVTTGQEVIIKVAEEEEEAKKIINPRYKKKEKVNSK
jgi:hypothetical protein